MNRTHDYQALEQEFISGDMSVRELVRRHGFANASSVHIQARQRDWYAKREEYRLLAQQKTVERMADVAARRAERELEVRDHALEAIDDAIGAMQDNLHKTRRVQHDGEWVEEPLVVVGPREIVALMDRLQTMFFNRPSQILEQRSLDVHVESTEAETAALYAFAEYARERAHPKGVGPDALPSGPASSMSMVAER